MKKTKVVILPYDKYGMNPYLDELSGNLQKLGVVIQDASSSHSVFFFDVTRKWHADVLHVQWVHAFLVKSSLLKSFVSMFIFLTQLLALRLIGVRIVWTVHNLKNHDNQYLAIDSIGTAAVARISHAIIVHCESAKNEVVKAFRLMDGSKISVIPHGNYINCYKNDVSQSKAREILHLSEKKVVLLFFGLIRPYKGVMELLEVFSHLKGEDAELLIVGKISDSDKQLADQLQDKTRNNANVRFIPGFVEDDRVQVYMNACNVVVFPYRDALTSGAVQLAMSFGRACVAPQIGCIGETLDEVGSFLYDPDSETGLLGAISNCYSRRANLSAMGEHNRRLSESYTWGQIARKTCALYL